tara:strand:+ start:2295 stop:2660 length:366 start_codon:yes stop_codon:yes gene_type:complete
MNNNIFFNSNKKFNPDIDTKLTSKKNERKVIYELKNKINKPILKGEINQDIPINLQKLKYNKQQERDLLDVELAKKKYNHRNSIATFKYTPVENITKPIQIKKTNKSDKILNDLKALGIIK